MIARLIFGAALGFLAVSASAVMLATATCVIERSLHVTRDCTP